MMTTPQKVAIGAGAAVVATIVIVGVLEHKAHAQPPKPKPTPGPKKIECSDGTTIDVPADATTAQIEAAIAANCPPPKPPPNPLSPPSGWTYTGNPTVDYIPTALALAAVDPCRCENVIKVRQFQRAAGLVQSGESDGRYYADTALALKNALADAQAAGIDISGLSVAAPCSPRPSWWGPRNMAWPQSGPNPYENPGCQGDPGPNGI